MVSDISTKGRPEIQAEEILQFDQRPGLRAKVKACVVRIVHGDTYGSTELGADIPPETSEPTLDSNRSQIEPADRTILMLVCPDETDVGAVSKAG